MNLEEKFDKGEFIGSFQDSELEKRDMFEIKLSPSDIDVEEYDIVDFFINGRNLIEIIRESELPYAEAEDHPGIAGSYIGLHPSLVLAELKSILKKNETISKYPMGIYSGEKVQIYRCDTCGIRGCWSLYVKISITADLIIWSDFENPHRGQNSKASHWQYENLERFIFNRQQYATVLKQIMDEQIDFRQT